MIRQNHIDPLPRVKAIRVFLDDRDNKREYILREDGSVRYKGKNLPEYLTYVDERMIAGWDGTYYRVMDKDGKEVLRILERDVQSDL